MLNCYDPIILLDSAVDEVEVKLEGWSEVVDRADRSGKPQSRAGRAAACEKENLEGRRSQDLPSSPGRIAETLNWKVQRSPSPYQINFLSLHLPLIHSICLSRHFLPSPST